MMPKPIDSEKKIWPYAATHTLGRASAAQSGREQGVEARRAAPSRNSACTTRTAKATTSTGMKTTEVAPMPLLHAERP